MKLNNAEKIEFLKSISLFDLIPEGKLAQLVEFFEEVAYPPNTLLCREGDPADFLYLIISGQVSLVKDDMALGIFFQGGEIVGEVALLDKGPRSASLMAATELRALRLNNDHFDQILIELPQFSQALFKVLSSRLRSELNREIEAIRQRFEKLKIIMDGTVSAVALMVEMKDPYTAGHQRRVSQLAAAIAEELGFSKDQVEGIRISGLLHDVGKISVPTEILCKPGKISQIEYSIIKTHAQIGYQILKQIEFPWPVAQVALQHHERINGSGYPSGLSDEDVIFEAKIMAVADVVEAMSSHRPYRPALGVDAALDEISKNSGNLYGADVVKTCLHVFNQKGFKFE